MTHLMAIVSFSDDFCMISIIPPIDLAFTKLPNIHNSQPILMIKLSFIDGWNEQNLKSIAQFDR